MSITIYPSMFNMREDGSYEQLPAIKGEAGEQGPAGPGALYFTSVAVSATTGDIATVSNAAITADHVVASVVFASPSSITTDVTWTTATGSLTLNGTCSSATTADVILVKKTN